VSTRILIVDDEDNQRMTLAIALRLEGFDVIEARDGEDALGVLESRDADIAIVDLMMPGINGLDVARRMRTRHPDVRVVLTSAYHLSERQMERADVGAIGFVPKPYRLEDLCTFLRAKAARAGRSVSERCPRSDH
jgi:DNA-binding response OmpR family regulator